jgi:hypothetical protein
MAAEQCSCGLTKIEGADETIEDQAFEMFVPDHGEAADGLLDAHFRSIVSTCQYYRIHGQVLQSYQASIEH